MEQKCSFHDCDRDTFQGQNECILHCKKYGYHADWSNSGLLRCFYDELISYIADYIDDGCFGELSIIDKKKYLNGDEIFSDEIEESCRSAVIIFNSIYFPCRDARDTFDYFKILKKIGRAHFNYCKFTAASLDIGELGVFYQDCEFLKSWSISNTGILDNVNSVIYQGCTFKDNVQVFRWDNDEGIIDHSLFHDCKFDVGLALEGIKFKKPVFNNSDEAEIYIPKLKILNCSFEEKFKLNRLVANSVEIINTEFFSKTEIKYGEIASFNIKNTNFNGLYDAYSSEFGEFISSKNIFSDFVGFELCKFSLSEKRALSGNIVIFQYTTFLSFTNFRNAVFYGGLNLEDANLKESPNFLNIELKSNNTNRETLRIIKDSFDKVGNHIEANKFFVLEMKKYKEELFLHSGKRERLQEKVVYSINEHTSNFGQNYVLSTFWVLVCSSIYSFLVFIHKKDKLNLGVYILDDMAQSMIPFKTFLESGMEFVSLIFYIIFAVLIWQTIVAVKRYTKR